MIIFDWQTGVVVAVAEVAAVVEHQKHCMPWAAPTAAAENKETGIF